MRSDIRNIINKYNFKLFILNFDRSTSNLMILKLYTQNLINGIDFMDQLPHKNNNKYYVKCSHNNKMYEMFNFRVIFVTNIYHFLLSNIVNFFFFFSLEQLFWYDIDRLESATKAQKSWVMKAIRPKTDLLSKPIHLRRSCYYTFPYWASSI